MTLEIDELLPFFRVKKIPLTDVACRSRDPGSLRPGRNRILICLNSFNGSLPEHCVFRFDIKKQVTKSYQWPLKQETSRVMLHALGRDGRPSCETSENLLPPLQPLTAAHTARRSSLDIGAHCSVLRSRDSHYCCQTRIRISCRPLPARTPVPYGGSRDETLRSISAHEHENGHESWFFPVPMNF